MRKNFLIIFLVAFSIMFPLITRADVHGEQVNFFVNAEYDIEKRQKIAVTLRVETENVYIYIEDDWWNSLDEQGKTKISTAGEELAARFSGEIAPILTSTFGIEKLADVMTNEHFTILVHRMRGSAQGYVQSTDNFSRLEFPKSNQRKMAYLNAGGFATSLAKSYLAHEFTHLIQFKLKEERFGVIDDIWFQEGIAELASTFVGYDRDEKEGTYLLKRKRDFISNSRDSLTEWKGNASDYGVATIFFQYIRDQYGQKVIVDAAQSPKIGIEALNESLVKNGIAKKFEDVFTDWTIALFVNDCAYGEHYCFRDPNLADLRIAPFTTFLSSFGSSDLTLTNPTKDWSGNWHRISGGKEQLTLSFEGNSSVPFVVPYILQTKGGEYEIRFMDLDAFEKGSFHIADFEERYTSVTILPAIQSKFSEFSSREPSYFFNWRMQSADAKTGAGEGLSNQEEIKSLLNQIARLEQQLEELQKQLTVLEGKTCSSLTKDLSYGITNDEQVKCLQSFLAAQGSEIYPERIISGNFLGLTQSAVKRFQERYAKDILAPLGLAEGTGFVGERTRAKMNDLLRAQEQIL